MHAGANDCDHRSGVLAVPLSLPPTSPPFKEPVSAHPEFSGRPVIQTGAIKKAQPCGNLREEINVNCAFDLQVQSCPTRRPRANCGLSYSIYRRDRRRNSRILKSWHLCLCLRGCFNTPSWLRAAAASSGGVRPRRQPNQGCLLRLPCQTRPRSPSGLRSGY